MGSLTFDRSRVCLDKSLNILSNFNSTLFTCLGVEWFTLAGSKSRSESIVGVGAFLHKFEMLDQSIDDRLVFRLSHICLTLKAISGNSAVWLAINLSSECISFHNPIIEVSLMSEAIVPLTAGLFS